MNTRRGLIKSCTLILTATALSSGVMAKSSLWKVTSKTGTLYLQGSVHFLKADNYPLAPAIEEAYAASTSLVLEVDMAEMTSPATQQRIMSKAMLSGSNSLQQAIDAESYQKLSQACEQIGLPTAALDKFKPWFAIMTMTMSQLQKMGFESKYGLDAYFYGKAATDGKKVTGLETVDFQIDLFESLSTENPTDFVKRSLADLEMIELDSAMLVKAWETGDIENLGSYMLKNFKDYPKFHKTFILDRNKRWLNTLDGLLKTSETHMVVVGAGHLPGKGGLLELLKQKGHTLEQL